MLNLWMPDTPSEEWSDLAGAEYHCRQAEEFREYLQRIDSRFDLIWVKRGATSFPIDGRWYIIRKNEGAPTTFWVVCNPDESYCLPDERHMRALQARDAAAHPRLWEEHRKACARERLDRELRKEERHAQFRESLADRLDHLFDARISLSGEAGSRLQEVLGAHTGAQVSA